MKPMMNCSDDSLRLLLREDEQSGDYREAARHVDSCPHCQQRIGELAAEDDEWQEAHEMLLAGDDSGKIDELSDHKRSRGHWQRRPTAWTEAMARQLLSPPSHPEMLGRIGRYEVERLIGTGGMGVVFKAFDSELNRPVAVKLLAPYLAGSGAARKRFAREARAAAAVVHEHVVSIHNVETDGEVPFLVMQYVPGESLQSRLDREGALDICEILRIGMQTASGLAAAHAQGLVHRDVKPSNVLLEKGVERSLLTDFGLARASDDASLTRSGHHPGTPQYMSPEQARGDAVDARSDLFSLGSVMYAMCTGRPPFRAESSYGVLRRITDAEPRPIREINPNIPEWLERLIQKLLAKSLVDRFQTAEEVAELLRQCLAHVQQPKSVPLPTSLVAHAAGRRSIFNVTRKGVFAMLGTIGMTLLGMVLLQATEAPEISGLWTSDEWGTVVLEAKGPGQYAGTFSGTGKGQSALGDLGGGDSVGRGSSSMTPPGAGGVLAGSTGPSTGKGKSGTLHLKWSRVERRFNGTWGTGGDRSGKISLRLVDNEIRGAWTTDKDAQKEPGTPRLGDLLWTRSQASTSETAKSPTAVKAPAFESIVPRPVLSNVTVTEKSATVVGMGGDNQECVLRIAKSKRNKQLEWTTAPVKGRFTVTVTATDQLPSDNGKMLKGIVLTVQNPTSASIANIGMSEGDPVPAGTVRFRQGQAIDRADTMMTIADILCDDGTTIPISILVREKVDRRNARMVAESYIAAALADDVQTAASLATDGPAVGNQIESLSRQLNVQRLVINSVYMNDPARPTRALATSEATKLTKKQPNGQRDGFLVLTLTMTNEGWSVTDIDFESEEGAADELKRFREAHPMSIDLPPLTRNSETDVKLYAVQDLPLWSKDGTTQHIDLLIHYLEAKVNATKIGGDKIGSYDAGRGMLVVRGDARKHGQIAQVLTELRASSGQPVEDQVTFNSIVDLRSSSGKPSEDLAKEKSLKTYSIADLPIWSKDEKKQYVGLLLSYLRSTIDPPSWESKATHAVYNAETLSLVVQGAPEVHKGIKAALSRLRALDLPREVDGDVHGIRGAPTTRAESPPKTTSAIPTRVSHITTARSIRKIACSADGKLVAVAHSGQASPVVEGWKRSVEILEAETGKSVVVISLTNKDEDAVLAATEGLSHVEVGPLAFSPDGSLLAVGTSLGQVKFFKPQTGELVLTLDDEPAKLAEQKTPKELKSLKRAMGAVGALAFSPDGTRLATSGSSFEDTARHWGGVERLRELVTGPGRLMVWDVKSGKLIHDLVGHSHAEAVSFSADGSLLASAGRWLSKDNGTGVIIWNVLAGKQLRTIANAANGGTHAVVFSPTGNLVAIGSRQFDKANDTSTTTLSLTHAMSGITEWQQTLPGWARPGGFSPDGKSLVVLCGGEAIRFVDTETGAVKREVRSADSPQGGRWNDFAMPPRGRRLAIGGVDNEKQGTVEIWDFVDPSSSAANRPTLLDSSAQAAVASEPEVRFYDIQDLPIWDRDGRSQQIDLLCHYLGLDTDETKALSIPLGSYEAPWMSLRVRASAAKHKQVAQLLADLRASSGPASTELTKPESLKVYSVADLPLWSKDGTKQDLGLLMHFLRSTVDPSSWEIQSTRAAYDAEKLQLVVQATPEVHIRIAAVLARPLPDPVLADAASIIACVGPKTPTRLGAVIANEDIYKGLDPTVMYLHVWDWTKSDVSRVQLIQKSELGVLAPDGKTMLTYDGEVLDLESHNRRQYSGFEVSDDQVITSLRFSPSGKSIAAMILKRVPHASDRKDAPSIASSTLRLLELDAATNTGKKIAEFPANADAGAAFATDELSLVYSSDKHEIIGRNAPNGNIQCAYLPGIRSLNGAVGISASPDGSLVAVADYHGNIYVWEAQKGKLLVTHQGLVDSSEKDFHAKVMRFSPDGAHLALVAGNRLKVMETATGKIVKSHKAETTPAFVGAHWSPDGKTITLLTGFQPTNFVDKDGVASHPTANIFPRVFEWNWREGSPVLKTFADASQGQTKANATELPGTDKGSRSARQPTGKQLGIVLGKPIHDFHLNKNTSTADNLKRLLLQPLMEDYCRKQGLDHADELNAKLKDERNRRIARFFVLPAELHRHLFEKHGGRVVLSAFGPVPVDGLKKWLEEREQAGDFELTDPELKAKFREHWMQAPADAQFASPDQIKEAFDPAMTVRFIDTFVKKEGMVDRGPEPLSVDEITRLIDSIKNKTNAAKAAKRLRTVTALDFGDGVDRESRQAWLEWWDREKSNIENAAAGVREFTVADRITDPVGNPIAGATVRVHVPCKSSPTGQYQLAHTISDRNGNYVLQFGIPPFATQEELKWQATFTALNPPHFVLDADYSKFERTLHRKLPERDGNGPKYEADTIFIGLPAAMKFMLRPAVKPRGSAESDASPKTEQPVPPKPQDKLPDDKADDSQSEARLKKGQTKIVVGQIQYSLPFSFPSVDSILSQMPAGKARPKHERIECELVKYQVSDARHYPLVGPAQLAQTHFKSTITSEAGREVVFSDTSHLIRAKPE